MKWLATLKDPQSSKYLRALTLEENGRMVGVLAFPNAELDGKRVIYEPRVEGGRIVAWSCYVPDAPFKHFPPTCRQRSAARP
jgi:hypothetical protein